MRLLERERNKQTLIIDKKFIRGLKQTLLLKTIEKEEGRGWGRERVGKI